MTRVLQLTVPTTDLIPSRRELAEAAGSGVSKAVKRHLAERDQARGSGEMRTGYYGQAANAVRTEITDNEALVTINKEGIALHYYGGIVYPVDAKALAIPKRPDVAGKRPKEADPMREKFALVWPKGETAGSLRDRETDQIVYLLVPKAKIKADPTVLPSDEALLDAGQAAMEAIR